MAGVNIFFTQNKEYGISLECNWGFPFWRLASSIEDLSAVNEEEGI